MHTGATGVGYETAVPVDVTLLHALNKRVLNTQFTYLKYDEFDRYDSSFQLPTSDWGPQACVI